MVIRSRVRASGSSCAAVNVARGNRRRLRFGGHGPAQRLQRIADRVERVASRVAALRADALVRLLQRGDGDCGVG